MARARARTEPRTPLSRERVLRAAVAVADASGIDALTMRRLAEEVGSEAMSLYYHVANKEDLLDGIVDVLATEINEAVARIDGPTRGAHWKQAARRRILAAREVLLRHPWAPAVLETRTTMSPALLRYHDGLLGLLRDPDRRRAYGERNARVVRELIGDPGLALEELYRELIDA